MAYVVNQGRITVDGITPTLSLGTRTKFLSIVEKLRPIVRSHAARTGIPESWIFGIIWAETGFLGAEGGATAVSPAGAIGRMQLMPFWFSGPTAIGDGRGHTTAEMFDDDLNIRFGSDLLKLIQQDGNDLIRTSSIYNCGSEKTSHPWTPHPSPPWVGKASWGVCGEKASSGDVYQDGVSAANNTFLDVYGQAGQVSDGPNLFKWFVGGSLLLYGAKKLFLG